MNMLLSISLLVALLQAPISAPQGRQAGVAIEGVVVRFGTGDPVPNAGVELRLNGNTSSKPLVTATATDGKYQFKDVRPGEYRLTAAHSGFVRTEYGQRGPNGHGVPITIGAQQDMTDAQIALIETGSISGRIQNANGDPIANVQVQALKSAYFEGRRALRTVKGAVTNDLGEYRLYWLPPEEYVVMATPINLALPDSLIQVLGEDHTLTSEIHAPYGEFISLPDEEPSRAYFFPGSTDAQFATPVAVRSGDDLRNIDMILKPPAAHRVQGKVTNLPALDAAGIPDASTFVRLRSRTAGILFESAEGQGLHVADLKTGMFEIRGVLPGSYYLDATGDGLSSGQISIDVRDDDITNAIVELSPWFDVNVHTALDRIGNESVSLDRMIIDLRATGVPGFVNEPVTQRPRGAGNLQLRSVAPSTYRLLVRSLPESAFVKSIRVDGMEVLDREFRLDRAPVNPIEVTVALNAGTVSGSVRDDRQVGVENFIVVLVPDEPRRRRWDLYQMSATNRQGEFKFVGIAPGDYTIFKWEDVPENAWQDPNFISKYESSAKHLHIDEGSRLSIELR